jgi:hypothetical protein
MMPTTIPRAKVNANIKSVRLIAPPFDDGAHANYDRLTNTDEIWVDD